MSHEWTDGTTKYRAENGSILEEDPGEPHEEPCWDLYLSNGPISREMLRLAERVRELERQLRDRDIAARQYAAVIGIERAGADALEAENQQLREWRERYDAEARTRIAALTERLRDEAAENRRLLIANRELAATCTHPDMLSTQEGPLDV